SSFVEDSDDVSDRDFVAFLNAQLCHSTGGGCWNRGDSLLILQFDERLPGFDAVAFFDQNGHDGARFSAFTQLRQAYFHRLPLLQTSRAFNRETAQSRQLTSNSKSKAISEGCVKDILCCP